jgi:hypothetical protein
MLFTLVACSTWLRPAPKAPEETAGSREADAEAALVLPPPDRRVARPWLVALVSVGGLTSAAWEGRGATAPAMPFLAKLAALGASAARVEPVAPASHSPAHASLLTGRTPALHRIVSERVLSDRGVGVEGYARAALLEGPTLWSVGAEEDRRVAALGWPTTLGASIASLIPDIGITPSGLPWLAALADQATPGLLDLARAAGGDAPPTAIPGAERDRVLTDVACGLVASPAPPNLLLLHLAQARLSVARDGPDAGSVRESLAAADANLERLLTCLSTIGRLEGASVVVVGDHGSLPVHTALAPNALLEAEGLLAKAPETRDLRGWRAIARSNGGSAFVYARTADDAVRARRALLGEAEAGGLFRVVSAKELLGAGADPEAWFGLEARPGYYFVDDVGVSFAAPSALRGSGGYFPGPSEGGRSEGGRSEMASGFVAWGRGVRAGVSIPWMRQIDVAPTVARLLGVELQEAEGRPVVGILNVPVTSELARRPPFQGGREEDSRWRLNPAGQ